MSTAASIADGYRRIRRWGEILRHGPYAVRTAAALRAGLTLSSPELTALRRRRLAETVAWAYKTVPYYRRLLDRAGVAPDDICSEADLRLIPLTSKDDLRSLPFRDVVSSVVPPQRFTRHVTSGSTGTPFVFYSSPDTELERILRSYRVLLANGVRLRDRLLFIGLGAVFQGTWPQRLGILPACVLSAMAPVANQVETLADFRPTVLACYPSAARALAAELLRRRLSAPPIRLIFASGEMLDEHTTDLITQVFRVSPLSTYGTLELGNIGWQCQPEGAFHTGDDTVIVELVRDGVPAPEGTTGEVVVTALTRRDMPFIRYRTGDLARQVPRSCACRHAFGQIELEGGRISEVLTLPDGSTRSALAVTALVHRVPGILHFQLRQDRGGELRVQLVTADPLHPTTVERLRAEISTALSGMAIAVEEVPEIARTPGGKLPYVLVSPEVSSTVFR